MTNYKDFENNVKNYLFRERGIKLEEREVKISNDVVKKFDFVSEDGKYVGDAKYYKISEGGNKPSAKLSVIAEYCWLLEKVNAEKKFLVFGQDKRVPLMFLRDFDGLVKGIEFYFFDGERLEKLNM